MKALRLHSPADAHSDARRLFRGSIWSVVAAMGARASTLCAMILTARYLDQSAFGMLGLIQTTVFMSGVFAGTGTGIAAMKLIAEYRDSDSKRAAEVISSSLALTLILASALAMALFCLCPWLATAVLRQPEITRPLQVGAILLPLTALNMTQNGVLAGFEVFRLLAVTNLLAGALALPVLLLAAMTGELLWVVFGLTIAMFLNCAVFHIAIRRAARQREIPFQMAWKIPNVHPALWKLALPAVLFAMLTAPTDWTCFAILARSEGGFDELGVFNAANHWFNICRFIGQNLTVPLIPILASLAAAPGDAASLRRFRGVLRQGLLTNLLLAIPVILFGMLASRWIMGLYGPEYVDDWPTLVLLLACAVAFTIQMPVLRALHAAGRIWLTFALNLLWAFVYVAATLWLVDSGSQGLATARLLSYVVYACGTLIVGTVVLRSPRSATPPTGVDQPTAIASAA